VTAAALAEAQAVAALRAGAPATPELVNRYYALCIPFYREFLGDHCHTGFYAAHGPIGPADQLRMEQVVAASARIVAGSRVLDVGCGVGGPACHLAATTGAHLRGLTPNGEQLRLARAAAQARGLAASVEFDLGEASKLPYADASFDAVLFFESPCHFPDRPARRWRCCAGSWRSPPGAPRSCTRRGAHRTRSAASWWKAWPCWARRRSTGLSRSHGSRRGNLATRNGPLRRGRDAAVKAGLLAVRRPNVLIAHFSLTVRFAHLHLRQIKPPPWTSEPPPP
jgi:SAM-dependent methyltransferase